MNDLFRPGGPHNIRRVGADKYEFSVTIPTDPDGMRGHECPARECAPAYFKVRPGTGLRDQPEMYCPYCRTAGPTTKFFTAEQVRYARDQVAREAKAAVSREFAKALGVGPSGRRKIAGGMISMEVSYKASPPSPVRPPRDEPLRRDVCCPHCTCEQAVFGLAVWCTDCGKDIFTTHLAAELSVLRVMLDAVPARRAQLGPRVAARDVEDALENTVSLFEATMKFITRKYLAGQGKPSEEINRTIEKTVRNSYQSVERGEAMYRRIVNRPLFDTLQAAEIAFLRSAFEKRHPIAHNLGVVDRAYITKAAAAPAEGRELSLSAEEVRRALDLAFKVLRDCYGALFSPPSPEPRTPNVGGAVPPSPQPDQPA